MAVYVDDARNAYRGMLMCHMVTDTLHELNSMADKIGVNRKWLQSGGSIVHYDICLAKRRLAVQYGAVEITRKGLVRITRRMREENDHDG